MGYAYVKKDNGLVAATDEDVVEYLRHPAVEAPIDSVAWFADRPASEMISLWNYVYNHLAGSESRMDGSEADTKADDARRTTPEGAARETIDNLLNQRLTPKTIDAVHDAARRAVSDKAINGRKW